MVHKFKIPIGDWSDDGHGECEYTIVTSNKSVEEVREIYFDFIARTGMRLDGETDSPMTPVKAYEESRWTLEQVEAWESVGVVFTVEDRECILEDTTEPHVMVDVLFQILRLQDPTLVIEVSRDPMMPMFPFYGYSEGKHIGYIGYGLFTN